MHITKLKQTSVPHQSAWTHTLAADCQCSGTHGPKDSFQASEVADTAVQSVERTALGQELWEQYLQGQLQLLPVQVSGRNDGADARANIVDTASGREAKRSSYQNGPGGRIPLSFSLLEGMRTLLDDFSFRVTALAGGSHSKRSRHYLGVGLDVDTIDGRRVDKDHPRFREFMDVAKSMGATEVLGPGSKGHNHHIHIAWPRDARVEQASHPLV